MNIYKALEYATERGNTEITLLLIPLLHLSTRYYVLNSSYISIIYII